MRSAKEISKALHEHKPSLRKIDIDIDKYIGGGIENDGVSFIEENEDEEGKDKWYHRDVEISTRPLRLTQVRSTRAYGETIGSMHDFELLTHLSIGIGFLLGCWPMHVNECEEAPFRPADALPKSLDYLLIRGYVRGISAQYDKQIDEFLLAWRDRLPLLKELHGIDTTIPIAASIDDLDEQDEDCDEQDEDHDEQDEDCDERDEDYGPYCWKPEVPNDDWVEALK
ncbi:hypothetical protein F5Y19DRAFT_490937 [Xylariaceae sp. FL1651]|nr:hypothetical protein F5Y19DRAFT_490937 [Xylariaceae sp. FL1651]